MSDQDRPAWLVPTQYNDEPEIPRTGPDVEDTPIDYSRGPDRNQVFGDDLDDDYDEPEEDPVP